MNRDTERSPNNPLSLPRTSSRDLRGKQSVRATFRLSRQAIETISILAVQLGIKKKSLFDHLIEDMDTLDRVARQLDHNILQGIPRVQKTYVLSRRTLRCLDQTSQAHNTPRDALVEYSIQRLLPVITRELEKHRIRKEVISETEALLKQGKDILGKMIASLGKDDPVSTHYISAIRSLAHAQQQMADCVEKGEKLEDFLSTIER
ncbi:MAG: hypothetical protein DSY90_08875 [Deltaproteobacteria bacterium]|nr:MAG: hypothetical protein DSY90_08875 [Deltaproteobacteria bacterium]